MTISKNKKTTVVRSHTRRVPVSKKNPTGRTTVHKHLRHINGQYLDSNLINEIFKGYDKKSILFPKRDKLKIQNENEFDAYIAVWVDYFNQKLNLKNPIDPDMIKALIASESTFKTNATNKKATGLLQLTTDTLEILQDLDGEAKNFVFKDIKKNDLKNANICIALGVRWLAYKQAYAEKILNRKATSDEVIQIYKGILKDKSKDANKIMKKFREYHDKIKK